MIEKMKTLFSRHKEIILYLIFGGLTTLLSIAVFELCYNVLKISQNTIPSKIISNAVGIAFAYATNRKWVFASSAKGFSEVFKELCKFVGGRLFTVALDIAFVYVAVNVLFGNSSLWNLVSTVVVVILNYVISKLIVFVKKKESTSKIQPSENGSVSDENEKNENEDN